MHIWGISVGIPHQTRLEIFLCFPLYLTNGVTDMKWFVASLKKMANWFRFDSCFSTSILWCEGRKGPKGNKSVLNSCISGRK